MSIVIVIEICFNKN